MSAVNPVREALASGRFSYMVELVAGAKTTEYQLVEIAAGFLQVPGVVAGSVTSFAGGSAGHDPVRISAAMQARGLTPNVHLTCVGRDRLNIARALDDLRNLDIENVFAITGDFPKGSKETAETLYDLDSVQLVEMIHEYRQQTAFPFHISVAVSPFKYTEADCAYQYLKLEKKIAAGADYALTQLGFDSRKFRELKRYLAERGLRTPVFGNVYVLPLRAAEKFSKGEPPGCWASKELVEQIRAEVDASTDKGLVARLERAARMVAIVRGLGYAGAYIGGEHQAQRIHWIIERSEVLAPKWEELAEELEYAPKGGFYFFESPKHPPKKPTFWHRVADVIEPANTPRVLRGALTGLLGWIDKSPTAARALESAELAFKKPVFGCQACGNCVLGLMEYVCPMTCPKNLRNGPCGGTLNGQCEVIPEQACIWVKVYERAQAANRVEELKIYIPQRDRSLQGTSSYINYFLNRDSRPEHPQPLVQISGVKPVATRYNH
jgi:methylenetetrahydrofolate reductase (NADPH)